jgi:hypothetical protein
MSLKTAMEAQGKYIKKQPLEGYGFHFTEVEGHGRLYQAYLKKKNEAEKGDQKKDE